MKSNRRPLVFASILLLLVLLIGALPISGNVFILLDEPPADWPRLYLQPDSPKPGEQATVVARDLTPWVHVKLLVDDQTEATFTRAQQTPIGWEWQWRFTVPETDAYELVLYHDCDRGCREWARKEVSNAVNADRYATELTPTKLCTVFPNPVREWHGRAAWVVELAYAQQADSPYWRVDDLAGRVATAVNQGQRVLLRIDYDQNQSIPPPGDEAALTSYLEFVRRLARDARFQDVYGFVIGSGFNSQELNAQSPDNLVTPEWYARLFNGYGTAVTDPNNALAIVRAENPGMRVLVGAVEPWVVDMEGARPFIINTPWLNTMNTLVIALDEATQARAAAGIPLAAPDGFAIHAPGNPDSPKMGVIPLSLEPQTDLISSQWHGAQLGFRIYRDWLEIINSTPSTQGLPAYITASNTYGVDNTGPPAENYPAGWMTAALDEINQQPQVQALCWFVDYFPNDSHWDAFSLTNPQGNMVAAAAEFEELLKGQLGN